MKKQHSFFVRSVFLFSLFSLAAFLGTVSITPMQSLGAVYFDTGDIAVDGSCPPDGDSMGSHGWTITGGIVDTRMIILTRGPLD